MHPWGGVSSATGAAGGASDLGIAITSSESTVDARLRTGSGGAAAEEASGPDDGAITGESGIVEVGGSNDIRMRVSFQKCSERKNEVGGIQLELIRRVCLRVEFSMQWVVLAHSSDSK